MPIPGGADDVGQVGILRFPAQLLDGFFIGCDQHRRVPRPAVRIFSDNFLAGDLPGLFDDLQHRKPLPVPQVVSIAVGAVHQLLEGHAALGQAGRQRLLQARSEVGRPEAMRALLGEAGISVQVTYDPAPRLAGYLESEAGANAVSGGPMTPDQINILRAMADNRWRTITDMAIKADLSEPRAMAALEALAADHRLVDGS